MSNPTKSPDWSTQTLFLATRGATEYYVDYCGADDMYNTRVGFVLSSNVTVKDVSYQGTVKCLFENPIRSAHVPAYVRTCVYAPVTTTFF